MNKYTNNFIFLKYEPEYLKVLKSKRKSAHFSLFKDPLIKIVELSVISLSNVYKVIHDIADFFKALSLRLLHYYNNSSCKKQIIFNNKFNKKITGYELNVQYKINKSQYKSYYLSTSTDINTHHEIQTIKDKLALYIVETTSLAILKDEVKYTYGLTAEQATQFKIKLMELFNNLY
ncbi:hypothetical protein cand_038440 [Cryptosporidium andersoni]|uniref:Uncharacterized protein n=1 Tax=Cryptosporidium andersoni TaxID=117008 RepID=A0A1J4MUM5_9CRYT|nr:hypothetical protein cand_038440 [Cryptosporidium andersoni]